ncbi:MAG: hypothetical protein LCH76_11410 [Actinobacteria bacterium]|nr:hypothetical protein [Actinomycetota bacterium]
MSLVWRTALALVLSAALSGCTQPWMLEDLPGSPSPTLSQSPAPTTPTPSPTVPASPSPDPVRSQYPYHGSIGDETCVTASRDLLDELAGLAALEGVASFSHGALVKADGPWWTVAVGTRLDPDNPEVTRKDVDAVLWFVTNGPSLADDGPVSTWPLNPDPDDDAADRALTCLSRVPSPPPEPPEDSPASYTGRLAPGATCVAVSREMLAHLEGVGRVGGAITYSRGQMVQANKKWWTVAVVTEVHPNKLGHTRENVAEVVYFATNAPSKAEGAVYFVLDSVEQDTAAAAARRCLSG